MRDRGGEREEDEEEDEEDTDEVTRGCASLSPLFLSVSEERDDREEGGEEGESERARDGGWTQSPEQIQPDNTTR